MSYNFSILITTRNRLDDLKITLNKLNRFINNLDVEFIICDDGSTDCTLGFLKANYPKIKLIRNEKSRGLIFSRKQIT